MTQYRCCKIPCEICAIFFTRQFKDCSVRATYEKLGAHKDSQTPPQPSNPPNKHHDAQSFKNIPIGIERPHHPQSGYAQSSQYAQSNLRGEGAPRGAGDSELSRGSGLTQGSPHEPQQIKYDDKIINKGHPLRRSGNR